MPIVRSFIKEDTPQAGRNFRRIVAYHDDHTGVRHRQSFDLPPGGDAEAEVAAFVPKLEDALKAAERERERDAARRGRLSREPSNHLTTIERWREQVIGFMEGAEIGGLADQAERIDEAIKAGYGLSQLGFSPTRRAQIEARLDLILANRSLLKQIDVSGWRG